MSSAPSSLASQETTMKTTWIRLALAISAATAVRVHAADMEFKRVNEAEQAVTYDVELPAYRQ